MTYEQPTQFCTPASLIEAFTRERRYLFNVTPKTLVWYGTSFKAFGPVLEQSYASGAALKVALIGHIGVLRERNQSVSVNTYLRCIRPFLNWAHKEGHIKDPVNLSSL